MAQLMGKCVSDDICRQQWGRTWVGVVVREAFES